jgi:predicted ATP-grasp superfamily ATP-dependent carboligase
MESRETSKRSDTVEAVHRLKQEIDKLSEQQSEALKMATYVGMTAEVARECLARRLRITELTQKLVNLERIRLPENHEASASLVRRLSND